MIEFKHVNKKYADGTEALKDFSLKIHKGEIVTLIGPSGCGKTTTMKTINRLIEPSSGAIYIDGQNIKEYSIDELRWNIGYVLQQIALFPHMTIEENISVVPEMKKWSKEDIRKRNDELLNMVGLDPSIYKKRMPSELSGGQQQRVGVIRALAADPDIILMDEPFSALDPISREQLQKDVKVLQKEIKKTIVFVTHDIDEAFKMGDRVCIMREGELVQVGEPAQLMMNPQNAFVQDFLGKRHSPWLITAGEIAKNTDSDRFIQSRPYETGTYQHGTFIMVETDNRFTKVLHNGKLINGVTIEEHMSLYEVTERIQGSDQGIFPVLQNDHVVGVLSYQDIVAYLKQEADMKNEVLLSE